MATTTGASSATPPALTLEVRAKDKANDEPPTPHLGTVLVTGGCGFLGTHLVNQLVMDSQCGPVFVVDKDISRKHIASPKLAPGAEYIRCDITDTEEVKSILERVKPTVIFHMASPNAIYARRRGFWKGQFYQTNVTATANLLRLSKMPESSVKVFVYTSSASVYKTDQQSLIRETAPTHNGRPWPWEGVCESVWTKGVAHNMVLDENKSWKKGGLKTVVIVPGVIYGIGDSQALPLIFDAFESDRTPVMRIGKGENKASFVDVSNCADLHILAARSLMMGRKDVAGKAYNSTDGGEDVPFWWHVGVTTAAIRDLDQATANKTKCIKIPAVVMLIFVHVIWWVLLIFTLGYIEPPLALSMEGYKWATKDRRLNIRNAHNILGAEPSTDGEWHEDIVRAAVEYERERRRRAQAAVANRDHAD